MIKFAFLTPSLGQPGGAERSILLMARYNDPARMQCAGIVMPGNGWFDQDLGRELGKHTTIHSDPPRLLKGQTQRATMIKSNYDDIDAAIAAACKGADVLVTWGSLSLERAATLDIPVICVSQCPFNGGTEIVGITHLVATSEESKKFWALAPAAADLPLVTIPNGVEVDRICPKRGRAWQRAQWGVSTSDKVLLYLGRHAPDKNPWASVQVMSRLAADHKLIMIGNQSNPQNQPRPDLVRMIDELGLHDRVRLLGKIPRVGDALAGADCLLHLSIRDADPLTAKEAFLAGLPVVHSPAGAFPEIEAEFGPPGWGVPFHPGAPGTANVAWRYGEPDAPCVDSGEVAAQIELALSDKAKPVVDRMRAATWDNWTGPTICERWATYLEGVVASWNP